ncbi:MAG: ComEC family competence protein [Chloroflexota bacterium]|nr:ComEC family competence protein [Chloroflexota bacterium]MDQ5865911.1 ComEC family competence protein [Chloroflexota bacterium]
MNSIGFVVAWIAGCAAGLMLHLLRSEGLEQSYGIAVLFLAALVGIPITLGWQQKHLRWAGLWLLACLAGAGWTLLWHPPPGPHDLAYYNGTHESTPVQITAIVSAEPVYRDRSQRLRLSARSLVLEGNNSPVQVSGDMLTLLQRYPSYYVGEQVTLSGKLTKPPQVEGFDYVSYLARQGVYSYMLYPRVLDRRAGTEAGWLGSISKARDRVRQALREGLPEPQAALVVGVVTGDRTSIPEDLQEAFTRSGTSHILAISGQNISMLVGLVFLFYGGAKERRKMPLWLLMTVLVLLAAYTVFTGATPAVVRAALMSAVLLASQAVGRRFDPISALTVSAGLMSVLDPDLLLDAGFLLSFAAMIGLVQVSPLVLRVLDKARVPQLLGVPLSASIGAQLSTAPLILLLTGRFSTVSPLATLTTEFMLLPLMLAGIAGGLAGAIFGQAGSLLALSAWPPATWMIESVRWWASLPAASLEVGEVGLPWVAGYYVLVALGIWWLREGRPRFKIRPRELALAAGAVTAWTVFLALVVSG